MVLSDLEIRQLIASGETNRVELKVASPRPSEMAERLCGMANAQGGVVIVGIEDTTLEIVGVPDERMALTKDVILRAARQIVKPSLILDPPEPEVCVADGKSLVVATVLPSNGPIYQAGGVCWIRHSTHTIPLSVAEMIEIANDRGLVSWESQPARKATMQDIDIEHVRSFLKSRSERSYQSGRFDDLERFLLGMDCVTTASDGQIVPTNAGILFFGKEPQRYVPQSEVVCVLYRDELGVGGYVGRKNIAGTVQELIDGAEAFMNKYMAVGVRIEGRKRIELPEYPIDALREAIVNAIVHRDYSRGGERIRIFYYTNRIEIHSPGLLLPGITVEQMVRGEVISRLRNPIIADRLRDLPGYMESIGSGVQLMLREMRRMGLPNPEFKEMSEFVVIFRKAPVVANIDVLRQHRLLLPKEGEEEKSSAAVIENNQIRKRQKVSLLMHYVQEQGSITNRIYREMVGISESTALRDLEELVKQGALKKVGKRRGRRYMLP